MGRLIAPVFQWRVAVGWYVAAAGFMAALKLAAAALVRLWIGEWPSFGTEPLALIPFAIAFSTPFQAGEEIGWRGYALPRLASRFGLGGASLLLVMLLHAAVNNSKDIVPSALPGASDPFGLAASPSAWMVTALLWIAAFGCLARMPSSVPGIRDRI